MSCTKIRVLIAKPGLDGHDRGAKVVARVLRDAGIEVIYSGLHQTAEQIVKTAIQEDVNHIGLSILSGAHMTLIPRIITLLRKNNADDISISVDGIIPKEDKNELMSMGITGVFGPGTDTEEIVHFIKRISIKKHQ